MTNLFNTFGMEEREGNADECVYKKSQENLSGGERKENELDLGRESWSDTCLLCDFQAQVWVDQIELTESFSFSMISL